MSEITVALDAGHGGSDSGATYEGRKEKGDVLRLVRAVGKILEENGINVYYVRTGDEYETPFKKATDANNAGADYFVSIHRNSSERDNQYSGVETLVYRDDGVKAIMARNINAELEKVGFKNLGVKERPNLVVLKRTKMPAVLVEVGFINTDADNELFDERFNDIAQGIANGIIKTVYSQNPSMTESSFNADADETQDNRRMDNEQSDNNRIDDNRFNDDRLNDDRFSNDRLNDDRFNNDRLNDDRFNNDRLNDDRFNNDRLNDNRFNNDRFNDDRFNDNRLNDDRFNNDRFNNDRFNNDRPNNDRFNNDRFNDENDPQKLYRVQVGAYRQKENADRMLNSLLIQGFPAFIIYEDGYYKTQVGAYRFLSNAIKMERRLRRFRYNTYIVYS